MSSSGINVKEMMREREQPWLKFCPMAPEVEPTIVRDVATQFAHDENKILDILLTLNENALNERRQRQRTAPPQYSSQQRQQQWQPPPLRPLVQQQTAPRPPQYRPRPPAVQQQYPPVAVGRDDEQSIRQVLNELQKFQVPSNEEMQRRLEALIRQQQPPAAPPPQRQAAPPAAAAMAQPSATQQQRQQPPAPVAVSQYTIPTMTMPKVDEVQPFAPPVHRPAAESPNPRNSTGSAENDSWAIVARPSETQQHPDYPPPALAATRASPPQPAAARGDPSQRRPAAKQSAPRDNKKPPKKSSVFSLLNPLNWFSSKPTTDDHLPTAPVATQEAAGAEPQPSPKPAPPPPPKEVQTPSPPREGSQPFDGIRNAVDVSRRPLPPGAFDGLPSFEEPKPTETRVRRDRQLFDSLLEQYTKNAFFESTAAAGEDERDTPHQASSPPPTAAEPVKTESPVRFRGGLAAVHHHAPPPPPQPYWSGSAIGGGPSSFAPAAPMMDNIPSAESFMRARAMAGESDELRSQRQQQAMESFSRRIRFDDEPQPIPPAFDSAVARVDSLNFAPPSQQPSSGGGAANFDDLLARFASS